PLAYDHEKREEEDPRVGLPCRPRGNDRVDVMFDFAANFLRGDPHPDDHRDDKDGCDELEYSLDRLLVDGERLDNERPCDAREHGQRESGIHRLDKSVAADLSQIDDENADNERNLDPLAKRNYERFNHACLPLVG